MPWLEAAGAAAAIADDVCGSDIFGIGDVFSISQMVLIENYNCYASTYVCTYLGT